tara:strand:- start:13749 stop:13913 length:165 start_codon:yes stop_codon:yes gene_type:complete
MGETGKNPQKQGKSSGFAANSRATAEITMTLLPGTGLNKFTRIGESANLPSHLE